MRLLGFLVAVDGRDHFAEEAGWINAHCLGQRGELDYVDAAFIAFDLGHKGLWLPKPISDHLLRQPSLAPSLCQDRRKGAVVICMDRSRQTLSPW